MSETKQQVFEALLKDSQFDLKWWRERYEKAERFGRGHDVDDLYETPSTVPSQAPESPVEAR